MDAKNLKNIYTCFPGGKHKVLTMSFDDGRPEDRELVALFNKHHIKGTFNVNAGLHNKGRIPQSEYGVLYQGHEVACHTYLHPTIARSPLSQVVQQVVKDREGLEAEVGYPVRGLAYPNGSYSKEIMAALPALGIRYARTVNATQGFELPGNYLEWNPTCHFKKQDLLGLGKQFAALDKTQYLYMMYVWGHSYELPTEGGWEIMRQFCADISGRADIWYATNIEIVDYLTQARQLEFSMAGDRVYNPNYAAMWLNVEGELREIPGGALVTLF